MTHRMMRWRATLGKVVGATAGFVVLFGSCTTLPQTEKLDRLPEIQYAGEVSQEVSKLVRQTNERIDEANTVLEELKKLTDVRDTWVMSEAIALLVVEVLAGSLGAADQPEAKAAGTWLAVAAGVVASISIGTRQILPVDENISTKGAELKWKRDQVVLVKDTFLEFEKGLRSSVPGEYRSSKEKLDRLLLLLELKMEIGES